MKISKYCGCGNDFLIMNLINEQENSMFAHLSEEDVCKLAIRLCDRHYGVGADGFIALVKSKDFAYRWIFFNADGSYASMCGNAARCVGHFSMCENIASDEHIFESGFGPIEVKVFEDYLVQVGFGGYKILESSIHIPNEFASQWALIDTGVPHLVCLLDDKSRIPVNDKSGELSHLREKFNANISVGYLEEEEGKIYYASFERGIEGITRACGTGALAMFVYANMKGLISSSATHKGVFCIPPSKELLEVFTNGMKLYLKSRVHEIAEITIHPSVYSDLMLKH